MYDTHSAYDLGGFQQCGAGTESRHEIGHASSRNQDDSPEGRKGSHLTVTQLETLQAAANILGVQVDELCSSSRVPRYTPPNAPNGVAETASTSSAYTHRTTQPGHAHWHPATDADIANDSAHHNEDVSAALRSSTLNAATQFYNDYGDSFSEDLNNFVASNLLPDYAQSFLSPAIEPRHDLATHHNVPQQLGNVLDSQLNLERSPAGHSPLNDRRRLNTTFDALSSPGTPTGITIPSRSPFARAPTPEQIKDEFQHTVLDGPCTNTWKIPTRKPRRTKGDSSKGGKSSQTSAVGNTRGRFRGPLESSTRERIRTTRQNHACVRCRMQKARCDPDPDNPAGPCLPCKRRAMAGISDRMCQRQVMSSALLYRDQDRPYQLFSTRWQSMDIVDIQDWVSDGIKVVELSHVYAYIPYPAELRQFRPVNGDMVTEMWTDADGVLQRVDVPPYAIADMQKHARTIRVFIERSIRHYVGATIGVLDRFFQDTYRMAYERMLNAEDKDERQLLKNALRLWCACRATSNPHCITGGNRLTMSEPIFDPSSPWFKKSPMPPLIIAQQECITYTAILRPISEKILKDLESMLRNYKKERWLSTYLAIFILLHSCSMTTRRDCEYAEQISLATTFANPDSIRAHHRGAVILLEHFHYLKKGPKPFALALDPAGLEEVREATGMNLEHAQFIKATAETIRSRQDTIRDVQRAKDTGHDLYWVSQLFDMDWRPLDSA